jgi:uncharacterized protein YfiM (DUF2279 family)
MLNGISYSTDLEKNIVKTFQKNNAINNNRYQSYRITFSDSWFAKDKADHFLVSAFLTAGSYYFLTEEQQYSKKNAIRGSFGFAFSIGLTKEIRDGFLKGRAGSIKDIVANALGIGVTLLLYSE